MLLDGCLHCRDVSESAAGGASFSLYTRKDTETTGLVVTREPEWLAKRGVKLCSRDMSSLES